MVVRVENRADVGRMFSEKTVVQEQPAFCNPYDSMRVSLKMINPQPNMKNDNDSFLLYLKIIDFPKK